MTALSFIILAALGVWIAACILDLFIQGVREIRWERRVQRNRQQSIWTPTGERPYWDDDLPY